MSLRHANVIDLLAHDPATDEVVMTIVEPRPWEGTDQHVYQLQEKINAYLSFALDGEMLEQLPQLKGKSVRVQLDCVQEPDAKTAYFIDIVRSQIGFQGIEFSVCVVPDLPEDEQHRCCGGHDHGDDDSGCCGGHGHAHDHADNDSGCCGGHGGCGCS